MPGRNGVRPWAPRTHASTHCVGATRMVSWLRPTVACGCPAPAPAPHRCESARECCPQRLSGIQLAAAGYIYRGVRGTAGVAPRVAWLGPSLLGVVRCCVPACRCAVRKPRSLRSRSPRGLLLSAAVWGAAARRPERCCGVYAYEQRRVCLQLWQGGGAGDEPDEKGGGDPDREEGAPSSPCGRG